MRNRQKLGVGLVLASAVGLSGCNSLLYGKQYRFPGPDEPSAKVRVKYESGTRLDAMTFNESGCYAGYTVLPRRDDYIEASVVADKPVILTYWREVAGRQCQIPFSFTPQNGATYTLTSGSWSVPRTGITSLFSANEDYCGLRAVKQVGDVESVEPIKQLEVKTGFACLRFVDK